jgi:hypothetical protein
MSHVDTSWKTLVATPGTTFDPTTPVVTITPSTPWVKVSPLPDALVAALEDHFAANGDTLYYRRDGVWYAVHREMLFQTLCS